MKKILLLTLLAFPLIVGCQQGLTEPPPTPQLTIAAAGEDGEFTQGELVVAEGAPFTVRISSTGIESAVLEDNQYLDGPQPLEFELGESNTDSVEFEFTATVPGERHRFKVEGGGQQDSVLVTVKPQEVPKPYIELQIYTDEREVQVGDPVLLDFYTEAVEFWELREVLEGILLASSDTEPGDPLDSETTYIPEEPGNYVFELMAVGLDGSIVRSYRHLYVVGEDTDEPCVIDGKGYEVGDTLQVDVFERLVYYSESHNDNDTETSEFTLNVSSCVLAARVKTSDTAPGRQNQEYEQVFLEFEGNATPHRTVPTNDVPDFGERHIISDVGVVVLGGEVSFTLSLLPDLPETTSLNVEFVEFVVISN